MSSETTAPEGASFELPVIADIRVAEEVVARCRAALEAGGDVRVDGGDVERVDAAVVQCLVALHDGLGQAHRRLEFVAPSEALVRALAVAGVGELVG